MDVLFMPLLQVMGFTVSPRLIALACAVIWWLPLPFFLACGVQDAKRHEIDGIPLAAISLCVVIHAILFIGLVATLVCAVALYFAFRDAEFAIIGQADFVLLAHWLFAPFCFNTGEGLMIVESVVFLIALLVYTKTYRDENGKPWKRGKMVPLFPPYVVTVCIMAVTSIPVALIAYNWGF